MLKLFNMKQNLPSAKKATSSLLKRLSGRQFVFSSLVILFTGLLFLGALYYILNIQYQKPIKSFEAGPVTTPPKTLELVIETPDPDVISFSEVVEVSGQTGPGKQVLIFSGYDNLVTESKADGSFSAKIELDEGENELTVAVFDAKGQSRSIARTVYYSKEKI